MQKIIETLGGDKRKMLRELDKLVKKKTDDSPLDLFVEKDLFGQTKFILKPKLELDNELDEKVLEYFQAHPSERKKLLKEIAKQKNITTKVKDLKESVQTDLVEMIQGFGEAKFSGNTIKNVAIINRISKNNRIYSDRALETIVNLADGIKVFCDHEIENTAGKNRSVRDLIGRVLRPHKSNGSVYADLEVLENCKEWIFALATQMPETVGMSIRAVGSISPEKDSQGREQVESIARLKSVDLVSEPATTLSLFEEK